MELFENFEYIAVDLEKSLVSCNRGDLVALMAFDTYTTAEWTCRISRNSVRSPTRPATPYQYPLAIRELTVRKDDGLSEDISMPPIFISIVSGSPLAGAAMLHLAGHRGSSKGRRRERVRQDKTMVAGTQQVHDEARHGTDVILHSRSSWQPHCREMEAMQTPLGNLLNVRAWQTLLE